MKVKDYYRPKTLKEAYEKHLEVPNSVFLAGGLWLKKMNASTDLLIDLADLGLDKIKETADEVVIGAMVSLRNIEINEAIKKIGGGIVNSAASEILGPAFRESATIGGTVYGRYPFSDVLTALLTLNVELRFYPEFKISLEEYLNLKGKLDSVLTHIVIKKEIGKCFYKKVKITSLDYPLLNIAVLKVNDSYRISVGSRPGGAVLAKKAMELASSGNKDYAKIAASAVSEISFATSSTVSGEYRVALAETYIRRGLEEVSK